MSQRSNVPPLEYAFSALGALIVLGMLSLLGYEAARNDGDAPRLEASVVSAEEVQGQAVVRYEVRNEGSRTAEEVQVVGEVVQDGKTVEQVTGSIGYVPPNSTRGGALVFQQVPSTAAFKLRAASYASP
jgi:uncharacterized protein (TIGR02588 family)